LSISCREENICHKRRLTNDWINEWWKRVTRERGWYYYYDDRYFGGSYDFCHTHENIVVVSNSIYHLYLSLFCLIFCRTLLFSLLSVDYLHLLSLYLYIFLYLKQHQTYTYTTLYCIPKRWWMGWDGGSISMYSMVYLLIDILYSTSTVRWYAPLLSLSCCHYHWNIFLHHWQSTEQYDGYTKHIQDYQVAVAVAATTAIRLREFGTWKCKWKHHHQKGEKTNNDDDDDILSLSHSLLDTHTHCTIQIHTLILDGTTGC